MSKKNYTLLTSAKKMLSDTVTPVSIYLRVRDRFPQSFLLESSDYRGEENSYSFICLNPIAEIRVEDNQIFERYPDSSTSIIPITARSQVLEQLRSFCSAFTVNPQSRFAGLFGYLSYDALRYFEDIELSTNAADPCSIPELRYSVFQYIIAINHFKDELELFEHRLQGSSEESRLSELEYLINNKDFPQFPFRRESAERSNLSDDAFEAIISKGREHIFRGDIFQIVLSRRFAVDFSGDEFNVYRALRSINPSPYLFYFDYGSYKIFGSSPESQLIIKSRKAYISPIAGTVLRSGNEDEDLRSAEQLKADPKENAEHVMLVDLARNDLSKHCRNVQVESYREVQFYSHVIHLVSKVQGILSDEKDTLSVAADTFPAGTLSGAPKYKAMELIDRYEGRQRCFYGGAIGIIGFQGDFNHAITIRSFLSKKNTIYYDAGAGVVADSEAARERAEVDNKLGALRQALSLAERL